MSARHVRMPAVTGSSRLRKTAACWSAHPENGHLKQFILKMAILNNSSRYRELLQRFNDVEETADVSYVLPRSANRSWITMIKVMLYCTSVQCTLVLLVGRKT